MKKKEEKERVEYRYYEVPKEFPIILLTGKEWEIPYGTDPMHFHNHLEIGICRYGDRDMHFGKETVPYHAGIVTVIPKNFLHHTKGINNEVQKWEFLFIDTDSFLLNAYKDKVHYANKLIKRLHSRMFLLDEGEASELMDVLELLLDELKRKEEFYKENATHLLMVLLLKIIRLNEKEQLTEQNLQENVNWGSIVDALNYIDLNYDEEVKIGELAKLVNMSETHFRRVFTEYINMSPAEYINFIRIEKACELMRKTDDRIEEIALKVGFPVATTFSRNFKKVTGHSPLQWKMIVKKDDNALLDYKVSVLKGW